MRILIVSLWLSVMPAFAGPTHGVASGASDGSSSILVKLAGAFVGTVLAVVVRKCLFSEDGRRAK